jgi:hypothetical protein
MIQNRGYVYLKPIHQYAFRHESGKYPEVDGVVFYKPENCETRACYVLLYPDMVDYIPVSEVECGNWEFTENSK